MNTHANGTIVVTPFDGEAAKDNAKTLALIGKDKGLVAALEEVVKAKEDWQGGPIKVFFALQEAFGDKLEEFPEPGSDTGNLRDIFNVDVITDGKTTNKKTSWYVEFCDGLPYVQALIQRLDWVKRASKTDTIKEGIPQDIIDMSVEERITHENYLSGRRNTVRGSVKRAMSLAYQMQAVKGLSTVDCDFIREGGEEDGNVVNTTKPIAVWQVPAPGKPVTKWEPFSVGSFLKLDVKKAIEGGGTFAALKKTAERKTGGAAAEATKVTTLPIATIPTMLERTVEMHRYLTGVWEGNDGKKDYGQLLKLLNTNGNDEMVTTIVEMRNMFNDMCKEARLDDKYIKLQQSGSELVTKAA